MLCTKLTTNGSGVYDLKFVGEDSARLSLRESLAEVNLSPFSYLRVHAGSQSSTMLSKTDMIGAPGFWGSIFAEERPALPVARKVMIDREYDDVEIDSALFWVLQVKDPTLWGLKDLFSFPRLS
jgi:hypothetical protein